jgi:hypothetical protein
VSDVQMPGTRPRRSFLVRFFGVIAELQTWKNIAYLLLAFPLGLFYFVFLVVGLSVGIALVIIWVGLPILAVTVLAWWAFATFERWQAGLLLGLPMTTGTAPLTGDESWWQRVKRHLGDARTWKDLAFLFLKFPLGIVSFVLVTVAVSVPAAFIGAPFYYRYVDYPAGTVHYVGINFGIWHVDTLPKALLLVPVGVLLLFAAFHLVNAFAKFSGILAFALLSDAGAAPQPAAPAAPPQAPAATVQPPQGPGAPSAPGAQAAPLALTASGAPSPPVALSASGTPAVPSTPGAQGTAATPSAPQSGQAAPGPAPDGQVAPPSPTTTTIAAPQAIDPMPQAPPPAPPPPAPPSASGTPPADQ